MSRKVYIAAAAILAEQYMNAASPEEVLVVERITYDLASVFETDNPNFSRIKFLKTVFG